MILAARLFVSLFIFTAPFIFMALLGKNADSGMALIFPFFGAIPAIIGALLVFAPIERLLDRRGLSDRKNILIPLLGAFLIVAFMIVSGIRSGNLKLIVWRLFTEGFSGLWPILFWMILGAIWGGVWRFTDWLARLTGLKANA